MNIGVEVAAHATSSAHILWAELYVDRATVSVPGQGKALLLGDQDILGDVLQFNVVDVVWELEPE